MGGEGSEDALPALCPRRFTYTHLSLYHSGLPALVGCGQCKAVAEQQVGGEKEVMVFTPSPYLQPQLQSDSPSPSHGHTFAGFQLPWGLAVGSRRLRPHLYLPSNLTPGPHLSSSCCQLKLYFFCRFLPLLDFFFLFQPKGMCPLSSAC